MKSIGTIVYTAALALSALNFPPSLASAQEARGTFKLTHDAHWGNQMVAAGEYRFTLESEGPTQLLVLRKLSGSGSSSMMLVTDTEASKPTAISRLLLISRPEGRFVSAMDLPEAGITLHFAVPPETNIVAKADSTITTASAR
jgi:hypothetical protein